MNPYLLKELRQLVRSKIVSGGIVVLLFGQLLAAALVVPAVLRGGGAEEQGALGAILLAVLGGILGLALCGVLPFLVFARFVAESPKDRASLEMATAAPPAAVVDGKVQAGLALAASLVAGSMPFQLLCVALRGVDVVAVLLSCGGMLLACLVQLHFAAVFAAARSASAGRRWASMVLFQFFFGQYALFGGVAAAFVSAAGMHGGMGPSSVWLRGNAWDALAGVAAVASLAVLLRASATRSLSPPTTDRDRVPRLTLLSLWAGWGLVAAGVALWNEEAAPLAAWAMASLFALVASFYAAAGAPRGVPRRVLAERPASRARRRLRAPFSAGFAGGLVFVAALLVATAVAFFSLAGLVDPTVSFGDLPVLGRRWIAAALYALAVPAILRGVLSRGSSGSLRLSLVPTASFAALLLAQLPPLLLSIGRARPPSGLPFFLPGVFLCDGDVAAVHLVLSGIAALAGLAAVFPEVSSSLRAYLAAPADGG